GVEFRDFDGKQGIGFGYNTIYATGSNANQDLGLKAKGTGQVKVNSSLSIILPQPEKPSDEKSSKIVEALVLGPTNASNLRLGYHQDYSWIQSHGNKPLL
ncbi:hypothetical protein, partial [Microcystis aeruginosa]|uniref:hypothetical protein n=1 Tax=Microcystis aeruginosa TaxID=1126 RepID=UPI00132FBA2D